MYVLRARHGDSWWFLLHGTNSEARDWLEHPL